MASAELTSSAKAVFPSSHSGISGGWSLGGCYSTIVHSQSKMVGGIPWWPSS